MSQPLTKSEKYERPAAEVREGSVKIALWQRQGRDGVFYTAGQPQLSYKDKDGNWQESSSYSEYDLVDLMMTLLANPLSEGRGCNLDSKSSAHHSRR